jgi:X-X-X-Leu-X-X-Gly heptad repeat protein
MYLVATLPGQSKPEFLLMASFTPRNKDNLIGLMVARCDGDSLGEIQVLQLSKQELIFGPMQVGARINQDQNISKDLSLWNQQGSQVLRGQMLVLPIGDTFLYVDPIYIQATQAKMPQLKKVVLSSGNRLIYTDTYAEGLAQLSSGAQQLVTQAINPPVVNPPPTQGQAQLTVMDARLGQVREHLRRYRELSSQGKWSEAGKELEAIESLVRQ